MRVRASLLLAVALCAIPRTPRADEPRKPLSDEDTEVVKQLAQLEQLELLRNLELFDPRPADGQSNQQQPDAGTAREP